MKGFFFPVNWPENHPSSLYETLGKMGGWVYVAKPYLLVVYLSSQLRDLRSVYSRGTQAFHTGTGFPPLSSAGKSLSVKIFSFLNPSKHESGKRNNEEDERCDGNYRAKNARSEICRS